MDQPGTGWRSRKWRPISGARPRATVHGAAGHSGPAGGGAAQGCAINTDDLTYFVGHETIVAARMAGSCHWLEAAFAFMQRNSVHVTDFFRIPPDSVVEIGRQVSI